MVDCCLRTDGLGYQVFNVANDGHSVALPTAELAARGLEPMPAYPDAEREAFRTAALDGRRDKELWVFAYGSLIWKPAFEFDDRRPCLLHGWHRSFCLNLNGWRATPDQPGLMLALDRGGSCTAMTLMPDPADWRAELALIWRREMLTGAYRPRWIKLKTDVGPIWGIAFVINPHHDRYIGRQPDETVVHLLRTGRGVLGSCREYLDNTVGDLHALGIRDRRLESLQRAVAS